MLTAKVKRFTERRARIYDNKSTYRENITPQSPVLNTTSIVPQLFPVKTYKSLANVMPGKRFVKKTYTALAKISWLKTVQSDLYRRRILMISCFTSLKGRRGPPAATEPRSTRNGFGVCLEGVMIEWASSSGASVSESPRFLFFLRLKGDLCRTDELRVERGRNAEIRDMAGCPQKTHTPRYRPLAGYSRIKTKRAGSVSSQLAKASS